MARPESYRGKQGVVDKGLDTWQNWNKLTLAAGGAAVVAGATLNLPVLVAAGATSMVIDGVQMAAIKEVQKRRARKDSGVIYNAKLKPREVKEMPKQGVILEFPQRQAMRKAS